MPRLLISIRVSIAPLRRAELLNLRQFKPFPFPIMNPVNLLNTNSRTRLAMVGAAMLLTTLANAADLVWIGGTGLWSAAGNWGPPQGPPGAANAFITNKGTPTLTGDVLHATNAGLTLRGASGV